VNHFDTFSLSLWNEFDVRLKYEIIFFLEQEGLAVTNNLLDANLLFITFEESTTSILFSAYYFLGTVNRDLFDGLVMAGIFLVTF
jgi:hypothetical protein